MSRTAVLERIQSSRPIIAPSMLKCDFGNLRREIELLESAGAEMLHWDVMDGQFVPTLSYGAMVVAGCREFSRCLFDAHLMVSEPERYLEEFREAGCDMVTVHVEAVPEPAKVLRRIRELDMAAGLSLNPGTPVDAVQPLIAECDLVLVMSVEPGFGGQSFIPQALEKLERLSALVSRDVIISVDGGIGPETIGPAARAGAGLFVAGTAVFGSRDYRAAIRTLRELAVGNARDDYGSGLETSGGVTLHSEQ